MLIICLQFGCYSSAADISSAYPTLPIINLPTLPNSFSSIPEIGPIDSDGSKTIITKVMENPGAVALGGVAVIGGFGLMMALQNIAYKKYELLKKEAEVQLSNNKQVSLGVHLCMTALYPLAMSSRYWSYNQWYVVTAAILVCAGHCLGYQKSGGIAAGCVLASGYFGQGLKEVQAEIAAVNESVQKLDANNTRLHKETGDKLDKVEAQLSAKLKETETIVTQKVESSKEEITGQISTVHKQMTDQIEKVEGKIEASKTEVTDKITTVHAQTTKQIVDLIGQLSSANKDLAEVKTHNVTILQNNSQLLEKTDGLFVIVEQISEQLASQKDAMREEVRVSVQVTINKALEPFQKINENQELQEKQLTQLLDAQAEQGGQLTFLRELLQKTQEEQSINARIVSGAVEKMKEQKETNAQGLALLSKLESSIKDEMLALSENIRSLREANSAMISSIDQLCENCNKRFTALEKEMEKNKQDLVAKMETDKKEVQETIVSSEQRLQQQIQAQQKQIQDQKETISQLGNRQLDAITHICRLETVIKELQNAVKSTGNQVIIQSNAIYEGVQEIKDAIGGRSTPTGSYVAIDQDSSQNNTKQLLTGSSRESLSIMPVRRQNRQGDGNKSDALQGRGKANSIAFDLWQKKETGSLKKPTDIN